MHISVQQKKSKNSKSFELSFFKVLCLLTFLHLTFHWHSCICLGWLTFPPFFHVGWHSCIWLGCLTYQTRSICAFHFLHSSHVGWHSCIFSTFADIPAFVCFGWLSCIFPMWADILHLSGLDDIPAFDWVGLHSCIFTMLADIPAFVLHSSWLSCVCPWFSFTTGDQISTLRSVVVLGTQILLSNTSVSNRSATADEATNHGSSISCWTTTLLEALIRRTHSSSCYCCCCFLCWHPRLSPDGASFFRLCV